MNGRYLLFLLSIFSASAFAGDEEASLKCTEANSKEILLSTNGVEFTIKSPRRSCGSDFTYEGVALPNKKWMITSWPTDEELGLNAQRELFIAPSIKSEAVYIGAIPVDVVAISPNTYRNITQSGGSIYETTYIINELHIEIKSPSRELVISNSLCVYKKESDSACQTMTGTFDKPLCLYDDGKKKFLKELSSCSELLENGKPN